MASVSDQLLASLENLVTDRLKRFKWHLKNDYKVSASDLETADNAHKTVDLMKERFGPEEAVKITVKILRKMNQNHLAEELEKKHKQDQAENSREDPARVESEPINDTFTNIVPRTRNDFLQYSLRPTLDLNTVNKRLGLSENNRVITNTLTDQHYPDHPDRFSYWWQVLCGESVSGRSYWEIEWRGHVSISVSNKIICRKGRDVECLFGFNDQSWSLYCTPDRYTFRHNNIKTVLSVEPIIFRRTGEIDDDGFRRTGVFDDIYICRTEVFDDIYRAGMFDDDDVDGFRKTRVFDDIYRTGVFVDPGAGTLSFFSVSRNTMSLIHTVQTTFTQTLYPGFALGFGSVKLC